MMSTRNAKEKGLLLGSLLVLLVGVMLTLPCFSIAKELDFPLAAYTAEELAKVREWEKTWVGQKIDKTNVDQVADFLPEGYSKVLKDPVRWGAPADEGIYFYIVPYKRYIEPKGLIEATRKYAPTVTLTTEGEIPNYAEIAGVPFPNPKTGIELAWNYDFMTHGDAHYFYRDGPNVEPGVPVERTQKADNTTLFWIHRTTVQPIPALPKNRKGISKALFMHMYDPPENKNSRFYNMRYIDPKKGDDGYIYYSPFRRLRRMGAATRTDSIDGTDMIYDDGNGWDGHIQQNTYKYLGKKELLCGRQVDISVFKRQLGQAIASNIKRERLNCFVVEARNKDPNYVYGKRIWYLDPESYIILWTELYDQLDRYWKILEFTINDVKTEEGEMKKIYVNQTSLDLQRIHAGFDYHKKVKVGMADVDQRMFTVQNLQKAGY